MGVEPLPKYVNGEFEFSNWHKRPRFTFFSESDGAPPTSMLLWGAAHLCQIYNRDANDSSCTTR